ncbi:hypothetical protein P4555_00960 [Peribacillus frigoritolerans]|uniref:hypothetical protein n=1 Tax=Peribacillus frigoritolerans TaxID=450367 RepID=UPI002E1E057A|nr:hypothetical protein [Peribacillus frigoritolerans]
MTRIVLTYQAPAQLLRSDSVFQMDFKDCLHVVATNSLKSGLGESMRDNQWIKAPILTFSELFSELSGKNWSSSKAQLKQFLKISDVFSDKWKQSQGADLLSLQSIERNQLQVLTTLRVLTELGMQPDELLAFSEKLSSSEKIFLGIWKELKLMLQEDIKQFSQFFNSEIEKIPEIETALLNWGKALVNDKNKDERTKIEQRRNSNIPSIGWEEFIKGSLKKKKIILHGFYFITPIQDKVFKRLEDEYQLVFLNTYDGRFPNTFSAVHSFLGMDKNKIYKAVPDDIGIHPLAARLVERFEGESRIQIDHTVKVYSDIAHFVEAEKVRYKKEINKEADDILEPFQLLTPRAKEVEEQLIANEFVPSSRKKLTDYPVGRFLYRLHQMKSRENNLDTGEVKFSDQVTEEALLDCFSSGCLIVNGEDMRVYVKSLEKILPYCKNISTFEQWNEQIGRLKYEKELWEENVSKYNPVALSNRLHKFHSLPMRQLSYFSVDKEDLEKIVLGINFLNEIHTILFEDLDTKKINITKHLEKIEQLVLKDIEVYFENDEKNIVKKLINEISELKDDELEFSIKDISQGLMFYLDGTLHEIGKLETTTDKVSSFDNADAAPFRSNRRFHLAFADHKSLPMKQEFNMWPISRKVMNLLMGNFPELKLLEERKNQSSSITRYLLYVLFHSADDIRFSYVRNLRSESRLELALYLKLLGCKPEYATRDVMRISEGVKEKPTESKLNVSDWTATMKLEAKVCGKRAAFSFILNEHTTFKLDFHHGFLYQNYMDVLGKLIDKKIVNSNDIKNVVNAWFPQWNNMKMNFLFESRWEGRWIKSEKNVVDGKKYSQAINYLNLLPTSYAKRIPVEVKNEEIVLHEAKTGEHCMYCPHLSICREGIYSIDFDKKELALHSKENKKSAEKEEYDNKNKESSLYNTLISKGLEVIDKRDKNGSLWLVGGENLQPLIDELKDRDIHFIYSSNGSRSTKKRPAWFYKGDL